MALARVVTFDGVSQDRMDQMDREMREGEPPEGFPSSDNSRSRRSSPRTRVFD
jgi:hypothetical protein